MLGVLHLQNAVCEKVEAHSKATEDLLQQVASLQAQLQENDLNKTKQITNLKSTIETLHSNNVAKTKQITNLQSSVQAMKTGTVFNHCFEFCAHLSTFNKLHIAQSYYSLILHVSDTNF